MDRDGHITRIEVQKRHPKRRSIFIDGTFQFGLDEEIVLKYGLKVGQHLDTDTIRVLLSGEEVKKAKAYALNLLSYRDRSCRDMKTRMADKGYAGETITGVIDFLMDLRLLDDERFALQWGRERLRNRPMGRRVLSSELRRKGISPEIIEQTIEQVYAEQDEGELALSVAEQRKERYGGLEPRQAAKKLAAFLQRRGFPWETVREAVTKTIYTIDETEQE